LNGGKDMKKLLTGIVTMGLVLTVSGTTAFAAGAANRSNFTDADNNGFCDYCNASCQFIDADGDGVCDNYGSGRNGKGMGCGTRYVDADGDGICDNKNKVIKTSRKTTRSQQVRLKGKGGNKRRGK